MLISEGRKNLEKNVLAITFLTFIVRLVSIVSCTALRYAGSVHDEEM